MGLKVGTRCGPYEIMGAIGAGGMGEVYRATDTRLGRDVALKVLPQALTADKDRLWRFEQEAKTVAALNHPNIMGIHDIGTFEGAPFLVSELLEGETLRQKIDGGPIPTRRTVEYALGIAKGLAAAHEKGIVHRDLKPENVFITHDGGVKILDFGLAKLVRPEGNLETATTMTVDSPSTMPGVVLGTIGYMSPEQVRGRPSDERSDIFSFGAVLYEMLVGKRAFKKDTATETMTAILKEDPPELTESGWQGPVGLPRILTRCLEKAPEQRFQSASDLAFAIEALSGTSTSPTIAAPVVGERGKSWKRIAIAGAALACLAVGGAAAWSLRPAPRPVPTFKRLSYEKVSVGRGRFASDGKTVVYHGVLSGGVPDTYVLREDYPTSQPAGLQGALVLAISKQDHMAVLVRPHFWGQYVFGGTLARVPVGGTAPRELLDDAYDADWAPDGEHLAVIDHKKDKWRVEYPIGKVLLETDNWISDIRVSPDGRNVAVFRHPAGSKDDRGVVLLLDRAGKQKVISQEWEALEGMAWTPNGKEIWYSAAESGDQYCVRASTLDGAERLVYCGTGGVRLHDIAASGKALLSTEARRSTMALIEHGEKEERDLPAIGMQIHPRVTPDGTEVVSTDPSQRGGADYSVYVQKVSGGTPVRIGGGGYGSDISNDGKWVLVGMPGAPKGRVQIIPVGAGETQTLEWDGFQTSGANWFPDGNHILLFGNPEGQPLGLYITDRTGSTPEMLVKEAPTWADVMPDGENLLMLVDGDLVQRSLKDGSEKKLRTLPPGEVPVDWAKERNYLFTRILGPTEVRVNKIDLGSEKRETWQVFQPKNLEGTFLDMEEMSITPDGSRTVLSYMDQLGEFYASENLR
jgi:eukaryotic-like serine/threonine-protein kinase